MKFTVTFIALLSITTSWGIKIKNVQDPKDKRDAQVGYATGHSSHSFQAPYGQEDASAVSIGAGYSVGGAKPSFSYGGHESAGLQLSSEGLPSSGHATIQLSPLSLQQSQGGFVSNDLSQLMNQISQGLNSGTLTLSPYQGAEQQEAHASQEISLPQFPQFAYGSPNLQQYSLQDPSIQTVPSYAAGTRGLGSYSSTGPVLFNPASNAESHPSHSQQVFSYGTPSFGSSGHSFGEAGALTLGGSGHSHSLAGHSLAGHLGGHSLGGPGISLGGGSGHQFGGSFKNFGGGYLLPGKTSFKPSAFIGASVDSSHGLSGGHGPGSYSAPSFGSHSGSHGALSLGSGSHGASLGFGGDSAKFASAYLPSKSEGFGSLESVSAFASNGQLSSPPGTTYGTPESSSYVSNSAHAASSHKPQYYMSSKHLSPSREGSSSLRAPSGHNLHSFSSGPGKYSFSGHRPARYTSPKDSHGAASETSYNTIKYSEEFKPRTHH